MRKHFASYRCRPLLQGAPLFFLVACGPGPLPAESPKTSPDERADVLPILIEDAESAVNPPKPAGPSEAVVPKRFAGLGLEQPSSVVYEPTSDTYLVANVQGEFGAEDKRAFVSQLAPDGTLRALKFIDGSSPGVELHSPIALAVRGNQLLVLDVRTVRAFAVDTRSPIFSVKLEGTRALSDLAVCADGSVFVSDDAAVFRLSADKPDVKAVKVTAFVGQGPRLSCEGNSLWVATTIPQELRRYPLASLVNSPPADKAKPEDRVKPVVTALPAGAPRGLFAVNADQVLLSRAGVPGLWAGPPEALAPHGPSDLGELQDIGVDTKRSLALVALASQGEIRIVPLAAKPLTESQPPGKLPSVETPK